MKVLSKLVATFLFFTLTLFYNPFTACSHPQSEMPVSDTFKEINLNNTIENGIVYFWVNTTSLSQKYHYLTTYEVQKIIESGNIYDPSKNYNVLINGHGTGATPPSAESLMKSIGVLRVLDEITSVNHINTNLAAVDLSLDPCFPMVDCQIGGTCAAWATTYYNFGYLEAKDNGWTDASSGNPTHLMSPSWTYNKVNYNEPYNGGSWRADNAHILKDWGCANLNDMPSTSDHISWGSYSAFRNAPLHRISDYTILPYNPTTFTNDIKTLLISGHPVSFDLDAANYGSGFSDGNYIISSVEYSASWINHAQTIVGFNDSIIDDGEIGAFKVVNSWGTSFGDNGYYWITYNAMMEIASITSGSDDFCPAHLNMGVFSHSPFSHVFA